jgi:hypothetical protein
MFLKHLTTSFCVVLLCGCATYTYTPVPGVQPAKLVLPVNKPAFIAIAPADAECPKSMIDQKNSDISLAPGKRTVLELGYSSAGLAYGRECVVTLSFLPVTGNEYVLLYEQTSTGCRAGLLTKDGSGRLVKEPSSQNEKFHRCLY